MFSRRLPSDLTTNRFTEVLERLRSEGRPIVDLTLSNPTRAGLEYPEDLLETLGRSRGLAYAPEPLGLRQAREAVALDYHRRGLAIDPARIALTASTSEAYSLLFKLLCDPGDEVIVPRPSYPLFEHLTRLDAVEVRSYDLDPHESWAIDFDTLERAFTDRTRAVLAVSPNPPTGSFIKSDELDRLAACCASRDAALIADEVFGDYELVPGALARAGRPLDRGDALVFSLGGLSKSIGLPQAKLAWIAVAGPSPAVAQTMSRLELICDTYLSVSTPVQLSVGQLLTSGTHIRGQIRRRTKANVGHLQTGVSERPACRALNSEGGWSGVLHVPTLGSEEQLIIDLLTNQGVLVHPGYFFEFPRESFLVVSLLVPETAFRDGLSRILRHFDCSMWPA